MPLPDRLDADDPDKEVVVGVVSRIWVEQVGHRDSVWFSFADDTSLDFYIQLDVGTTVALAQFQLLQLSLVEERVCRIVCLPNPDLPGTKRVYYVRVT
jgi:hypothetical protein